jgi:hypothetical protein
MRYVPSTSNVPSGRMVGRGNWPWPHPTARLHAVSATARHAPSPVHRPVASGPPFGPAGLRLQPSRPPHATSTAVNSRNARCLITPYNPDRTTIKAHQEQIRQSAARFQEQLELNLVFNRTSPYAETRNLGYFEGLDAERAIAWRAADSFAFLGLVLPEA